MCKFVGYLRVSTAKQGANGNGMAAQEDALTVFVRARSADAKLLASYIEVESGKRNDRPELAKAMEHARLTGATLLIAKLDRLSRNAHFLLGLQEAGVKFVAADMPEANEMVVGIMAVIAQAERKMISARTKAALQAARVRGVKLGNPNGAAAFGDKRGSAQGVAALKAGAQERADGLRAIVNDIRTAGVTSANGIARALNEREIAARRGGRWTARTVLDVLARLA